MRIYRCLNSRRILSQNSIFSNASNNKNKLLLSNFQDTKLIKRAFCLLSCVFLFGKKQSGCYIWTARLWQHGTSLILILYVIGDLINIISIISILPKGLVFASLISDLCTSSLRAILLHKGKSIFSTIKYLQKILAKLPAMHICRRKYHLLIGFCLSFIIPISFFVLTVEFCSEIEYLDRYVKDLFFGWSSQDKTMNCILLTVMEFITLNQRYTLPGFAMVLSCYIFGLIRRVLDSFEALLDQKSDFATFFVTYLKHSKLILNGIAQVESSISLLLLFLYSYMTFEIFSVMTLLIRVENRTQSRLIPYYVLIVVVSFALYILSLRAIAVHDSAVRVKNRIFKSMSLFECEKNSKQIMFLTLVADFPSRVVLRGWGLFDINRSFIQTTASSIFTYGILLSQLN